VIWADLAANATGIVHRAALSTRDLGTTTTAAAAAVSVC